MYQYSTDLDVTGRRSVLLSGRNVGKIKVEAQGAACGTVGDGHIHNEQYKGQVVIRVPGTRAVEQRHTPRHKLSL